MYWFGAYMLGMLVLSYVGSFGGIKALIFPYDLLAIFPFSLLILYTSQWVLISEQGYYHALQKLGLANN